MAKKPKTIATVSKAFMVLEATSFNGGFPAYMNMIMSDMEKAMEAEGYRGPFKWTWGGGDGWAVPVFLCCEFV